MTIDKNAYVIYNIFNNQGVFIMSDNNQKENKENLLTKFLKAIHEYYIFSFVFLFGLSIIIFGALYFCHSKNIENRFNNTLQNYEKSMSDIFNNIITNGINENIYTNSFQTNSKIIINNNQLQNDSIEKLKLSFEVGFKMLESSMNEIMKNSNDILQFWFAFLSVIMIVFTLAGSLINNNILTQAKGQLGEFKREAEDINKSMQESNKNIQENILFNLGIQSTNIKDYKTAEYYFTKIIELNPNNNRAYYNRGLARYYSANSKRADKEEYNELIKEAIEDYNKAIKLNTNISEAYNNRGNAKFSSTDIKEKNSEEYNELIKEAIEDYNKAIRLNPNFSEPYYNRGFAKLKLEKIDDAVKDFIKVYELDNDKEAKEKSKNQLAELADKGNRNAKEFCEKYNIYYKRYEI